MRMEADDSCRGVCVCVCLCVCMFVMPGGR